MLLCFLGSSHAALHLRAAAHKKGFALCDAPEDAAVIFVSEDTGIGPNGEREYDRVRELIALALEKREPDVPVVLTSQVEPGFSRAHGVDYHQAETLRIIDAEERAEHPDYIVVGFQDARPSNAYFRYLESWRCPVMYVSLEEAEFSKIAVNMTLAAQVDNTNRLAAAAARVGADWEKVAHILRFDKRIGHYSYLTPGRWQDSRHLLRDYVTLQAISKP